MELFTQVRIPFPPERVFAACRDDVAELVPYLPGIRSIEVTSRTDRGALVDLVVDWCSGADVPAFVRAVLGSALFTWTDYSTWDASALAVDWRTEARALGGAMRCGARDVFLEDGSGKTLIEARGAIEIDPRKIPGVPAVFGASVGRALEKYLVANTSTSLTAMARAMSEHLAKKWPASLAAV